MVSSKLTASGEGLTVYLRPVGNGAFDDGDGSQIRRGEITDGTNRTILIVEANASEAVPWTKPDDHDFDPAKGLGEQNYQSFFTAGMCDGSTIQVDCRQEVLENVKALFTKDAGDEASTVSFH